MDFHAKEHNWTPQPVAAGIVRNGLNRTLAQSPWISTFAQRLRDATGTRLVDWLDHIRIAPDAEFEEAGFVPAAEECQVCWLEHPGGIFPKLVIDDSDALTTPQLGIKVESIAFQIARPLAMSIRLRIGPEARTCWPSSPKAGRRG